jgi:hypothetical protein
MKMSARRIMALAVGAVLASIQPAARAAEAVTIKVSEEATSAWENLRAADAKISELLVAGNLDEVSVQADQMRTAVTAIVRGVRTTDEAAIRRLNSAGREILALAERLAAVAASGNRARTEIVHANLHRYVEFIQSKLPRGGAGNSRNPVP